MVRSENNWELQGFSLIFRVCKTEKEGGGHNGAKKSGHIVQ